VIEKEIGKVGPTGAGCRGRAAGGVVQDAFFFYFEKFTLVLGQELPGQIAKHISPGYSIPFGNPGLQAICVLVIYTQSSVKERFNLVRQ
jgi:hypothetical protein